MGSASRPSDRPRSEGARRARQGFALIATIWIAGLLALACLDLLGASRSGIDAASLLHERARSIAAAEAGLAIAGQALLGPGVAPTRIERDFEGFRLVVTIEAESAKVDLNTAPRPALRAALRSAGRSDAATERLLDAIEDWRDGDDSRRNGGAELPDYLRARAATLPRDGDFESLAELADVAGFDPGLLSILVPLLTLHGGETGPRAARPDGRIGQAFRVVAEASGDAARARRSVVLRPTGDRRRPLLRHADTASQVR